MEVLNFMNSNADWESKLNKAPYCISTYWDGDFCILRYSFFNSDFSKQIVRECRGSIFYKEPGGSMKAVCVPFYKFGNYGEAYVPDIDWPSSVVTDKIDGSLMKVWYHNDTWHLSTNGTIDARKAYMNDTAVTFYDVFDKSCGGFANLVSHLDKNYTYMFELTSPETKIVIPYDYGVYFLGCRNINTLQESTHKPEIPGVKYVDVFNLSTPEDCVRAAKMLEGNKEGFVVCDKYFNRMKIKGDKYLELAHLRHNGPLSIGKCIDMIKDNTLDDFLAYNECFIDFANEVKNKMRAEAQALDCVWLSSGAENFESIEEFAKAKKNCDYKAFLFARFKGKCSDGLDYILSMHTSRIKEMIDFDM